MWSILKSAVEGYIAHGAFSRGAAIAFYVVTSLAPVLLIVVAVAGLVFGQEAVRGSLVQQLGGWSANRGANSSRPCWQVRAIKHRAPQRRCSER